MSPHRRDDPPPSNTALRASLFGLAGAPRAVRPPGLGEPAAGGAIPPQQTAAGAEPAVPSAAELLSSSPAVVRLCESYQRAETNMTSRGRRQRLGIFLLVCAISVGGLFLNNSGALTASLVSYLVLAAAGASCAGVGLLALLWLRDERRLRAIQGERLLRALQSSCTLPSERLSAFRHRTEPVSAFFDCYAAWRADHPSGRVGGLMRVLRHTRA